MRRRAIMALVMTGLAGCSGEVGAAKEQVAHHMRDPSSAQFREVRALKQKDGSVAVCGEVNGKNAYGGYAGFQKFVVHGGDVHIQSDSVDFTNASEVTEQTEALRAHTDHCLLQGRTLEEIEAETAEIVKRTEAMKADS